MQAAVEPSGEGCRRARERRAAAAGLVIAGLVASPGAGAADGSSADSGDGQARVALTTAWAAAQRDPRQLADLQRATGARGQIVAVERDSETPRVVYAWWGLADQGAMRAFVYADGGVAAIVAPAEGGGDIVLNSFGAFVCPGCTPAVNACGHRPSWVPHDVHWDTFDCDHTLTGPQSLSARDRR